MATIPNRYYNSPWIAEAGRNLASALAPPDQNELLRNEAARFGYERAKIKAGYEDTDRTRFREADDLLGQLEGLPYVIGEDGQVDLEATHNQARKLADAVLEKGGREYYPATEKAMGTASPKHAVEQALIKARADESIRRDNNRGEININLQGAKDDAADKRLDKTNANRLAVQRLRNEGSVDLAIARYRNRPGAKSAKIIPDATVKRIIEVLDTWEGDQNALMSNDDYNRMLEIAIDYTLESGNPANGVLRAIEENPTTVEPVPDNDMWARAFRAMGGNPTDPVLRPKFKERAPAGETPLASSFETGAAPTAEPAPAPASKPKPKPATTTTPTKHKKPLKDHLSGF